MMSKSHWPPRTRREAAAESRIMQPVLSYWKRSGTSTWHNDRCAVPVKGSVHGNNKGVKVCSGVSEPDNEDCARGTFLRSSRYAAKSYRVCGTEQRRTSRMYFRFENTAEAGNPLVQDTWGVDTSTRRYGKDEPLLFFLSALRALPWKDFDIRHHSPDSVVDEMP